MDTRFLESFVAIAECGSIAEAARRFNLTPAAMSQRLRALETELGHKLIRRAGRTVRPTASGLAVLRHAPLVLGSIEDLRSIAADGEPAGRLRIGATATVLSGILPDAVARLGASYPNIELFLQPGSSAALYQGVLDGDLDAAVIVRPHFAIPKSLNWLTIREEFMLLIAAHGIDITDPNAAIMSHPFIRYDRNQWGGQIVERYLQRHHLEVQKWLELDALDAIASMVNKGLGVAIVPDWAPPWPEGLTLQRHKLADCEIRETGVLWSSSSTRSAAINAFVSICSASRDGDSG
ncbi:LysR family transcriptional regulator [Ruegeria arenilitoris]|uniref:LysR family transcriptional regulator n=1 Tax=Ruegeria arenilitoris TaxID=1173585 RepID=UPI001480AB50|nr:LysR family transcriptional regulator [Ruegeria arenilitoris]